MTDHEATLAEDWEDKDQSPPGAFKWKGNDMTNFEETLPSKPKPSPIRNLSRLPTLSFSKPPRTPLLCSASVSNAQSPRGAVIGIVRPPTQADGHSIQIRDSSGEDGSDALPMPGDCHDVPCDDWRIATPRGPVVVQVEETH
jgi:hypothetical protein